MREGEPDEVTYHARKGIDIMEFLAAAAVLGGTIWFTVKGSIQGEEVKILPTDQGPIPYIPDEPEPLPEVPDMRGRTGNIPGTPGPGADPVKVAESRAFVAKAFAAGEARRSGKPNLAIRIADMTQEEYVAYQMSQASMTVNPKSSESIIKAPPELGYGGGGGGAR